MSSAELRCDVVERGRVIVIELTGRLALGGIGQIQKLVAKVLTDGPDLVVLDLAGLNEVDDLCISIFPTVGRMAADRDALLVLAAPSPAVRRALRVVPLFVSTTESRAEAVLLDRNDARARHGWHLSMNADLTAPARARRLVEQACSRRPGLVADAVLVASELVTNAVEHTRTDKIQLTLTLLRQHLRIKVRDHDSADPVLGAGFGLQITESITDEWGCTPARHGEGKVVWADLPLHRTERSPSGIRSPLDCRGKA